jgi:hypothetical protein
VLYRFILLGCFILLPLFKSYSQVKDSVDSVAVTPKIHSPKKAAIMSAAFPGLGQIYNEKYWKLPLVYGGFTGLILMFDYNQKLFVKYRDAYKLRVDGDSTTIDAFVNRLSDNTLFEAQKTFRRYRDLSIIGMGLLYVLNIVDASVDGHLYTFDVSDKLTMNIKPLIFRQQNQYYQGLTININLNK